MSAKLKQLVKGFYKLPVSQKTQLVMALLLTVISVAVLPVFAWFVYQAKAETMSYVNDPPVLSLASGHQDTVLCFELKNIDVKREEDGSYSQNFIFSVETGKATEYDIQLTHTTNIPFTYELFRAKEDEGGSVEYKVQQGDDAGQVVKYRVLSGTITEGDLSVSQDISLIDLNPQNASATRKIGSEIALSTNYSRNNYSNDDDYNQFVEPLYSVARHIVTNRTTIDGSDDRDYFVLKVNWKVKNEATGNEYWSYAFNDKETDIIYITVKESQSSSNNP